MIKSVDAFYCSCVQYSNDLICLKNSFCYNTCTLVFFGFNQIAFLEIKRKYSNSKEYPVLLAFNLDDKTKRTLL